MEDFINSICGDSTLIDMDPDDSIDTALEKCKPFLDECCVIGSLIYNNKSKFVINTLTELLNNYVPLSYNFKENKLCFERTIRDIGVFEDMEEWMEEYHDLFYYTISSISNAKFNNCFEIYYNIEFFFYLTYI
ncbi:hypothetical protein H8356DRAFT_1083753 [Neocallimastix lanati (nom. inval.)]|nr:hypothetical protein H8356DRAFT_1083753 [Neocallimastix sp. JGI-2020a]